MLKLFKNLKDKRFMFLIIIILLFIQAMADLSLPDYTSKIVNVGIEQGGIESVALDVISKSTMEELLLFAEDKEFILKNYTLYANNEANMSIINDSIKKYPEIRDKNVYIKNKMNEEQEKELEDKMQKLLMINYSLKQEEVTKKIKEQMMLNAADDQKEALSNMSLMEIIKNMPEDKKFSILIEVNKNLEKMPDIIIKQIAITEVKNEYEKIGIDLNKLQNGYIIYSGMQMLGVSLLAAICGISIILLSSKLAAFLGKVLREKVFNKVLNFSNAEFNKFGVASLITRNTNDIAQIQNLIPMLFRIVIYAPIVGIRWGY